MPQAYSRAVHVSVALRLGRCVPACFSTYSISISSYLSRLQVTGGYAPGTSAGFRGVPGGSGGFRGVPGACQDRPVRAHQPGVLGVRRDGRPEAAQRPCVDVRGVRERPRPGRERGKEHIGGRAGRQSKRLWSRCQTTPRGSRRGSRNPPERGVSRAGGIPVVHGGEDVKHTRAPLRLSGSPAVPGARTGGCRATAAGNGTAVSPTDGYTRPSRPGAGNCRRSYPSNAGSGGARAGPSIYCERGPGPSVSEGRGGQ